MFSTLYYTSQKKNSILLDIPDCIGRTGFVLLGISCDPNVEAVIPRYLQNMKERMYFCKIVEINMFKNDHNKLIVAIFGNQMIEITIMVHTATNLEHKVLLKFST